MKTGRRLSPLFSFTGFAARSTLKGVFGAPKARIVTLRRRKTAVCSNCGHRCRSRYDKRLCRARDLRVAGWTLHVEFERWRVDCPGCGGVHVERLDWLAKNPRYTERFALHVGNLCRSMTHTAVAELERLHDSTVKDLSKLYMAEQLRRAGTPAPRTIGIDEIAIHKGHDSRVVVSDLERGRPICAVVGRPSPTLRVYGFQQSDAADAIRALLAAANVEVNRPAVEAGLLVLDAGGDFADGVIAYEGNWLGGETFVSFDKKAMTLLAVQGQSARLL